MGFFSDNGGHKDPTGAIWQGAKLGYTLGVRMGTVAGWIIGQAIRYGIIVLAAFCLLIIEAARLCTARRKE